MRARRIMGWVGVTVIVLLVVVGIVWRVLLPSHDNQMKIQAQMQAQARLTGAAKLYASACAYCHDAKLGPSLRGQGVNAALLSAMVRNGSAAMPAFSEAEVSDQQIEQLASFINQLPAEAR